MIIAGRAQVGVTLMGWLIVYLGIPSLLVVTVWQRDIDTIRVGEYAVEDYLRLDIIWSDLIGALETLDLGIHN